MFGTLVMSSIMMFLIIRKTTFTELDEPLERKLSAMRLLSWTAKKNRLFETSKNSWAIPCLGSRCLSLIIRSRVPPLGRGDRVVREEAPGFLRAGLQVLLREDLLAGVFHKNLPDDFPGVLRRVLRRVLLRVLRRVLPRVLPGESQRVFQAGLLPKTGVDTAKIFSTVLLRLLP